LLSGNVQGKLLIEMSTVRAGDHRALASQRGSQGGGVARMPGQRHGQTGRAKEKLVGFAGGTPEAFAACPVAALINSAAESS